MSMRLTRQGFAYVKHHLKIEYFDFTLKEKLLPRALVQLERCINHPYFITSLTEITVFDEATAIMLHLNGSDLQTYLNNLENNLG